MKNLTLAFLILISSVILTACQQKLTDNDSSKVQESIEKIKARIQETIPAESATGKNKGVEKKNERN